MAKITVRAPVRDFKGVVAGVVFNGGSATVDDEKQAAAVAYFRRKVYQLGDEKEPADEVTVPDTGDEPEGPESGVHGLTDKTPVAEVRAHAEGLGIDTEGKSKKVLLSLIAGAE